MTEPKMLTEKIYCIVCGNLVTPLKFPVVDGITGVIGVCKHCGRGYTGNGEADFKEGGLPVYYGNGRGPLNSLQELKIRL